MCRDYKLVGSERLFLASYCAMRVVGPVPHLIEWCLDQRSDIMGANTCVAGGWTNRDRLAGLSLTLQPHDPRSRSFGIALG